MADTQTSWGPLVKGSKHQVRIDNALPDVIIVTLKHERKTYHGALFHVNKENLCYGVGVKRSSIKDIYKSRKTDETVFLKPVAPEEKDISRLMERHTYTLDKDAVDPKWLSSPKRDINRPLISKNINKMRLRPRQVLCSVCKKGLNTKAGEKEESKEAKVSTKDHATAVHNGKRKSVENNEQPIHKKVKGVHVKSSPAIKISFASPKGVGTVLKIPPRPSTPAPSDSDLSQDNSENIESPTPKHLENYVPVPKLTKRDKVRKKQVATDKGSNTQNISICKKAKHNKHKAKKKVTKVSKSKKKQKGKSSSKENMSSVHIAEKHYSAKSSSSQKAVMLKMSPQQEQVQSDPSLRCKVVLEKLDQHSISNSSTASNTSNNTSDAIKCDKDLSKTNTNTVSEIKGFSSTVESKKNADTEFNYQNYFEDISDSDDSTCLQIDETGIGVPGTTDINDENTEPIKPLTIKIQTRRTLKTELEDGRNFREGDVIWGKIVGFPWWPGRITAIYESMKDLGIIIAQNAHISWFGSSTVSVMPCSELYPFLQYYKDKFSKKKRGPYKLAIKQAMFMAHSTNELDAENSNPNNTPSHISDGNSLPESDEALMDVTSTISNENIELMDSHEHVESSVHVPDNMSVLPCDDSQEVPNINDTFDIIQHASSEHHSEIYEDDVNFEIDESNCVAPSEVFRNVQFSSAKKISEEESDLEEGEILSDSNE